MADSLRLRETTTDAGLRATSGEGALRQDGFVSSTALAAALYARVTPRLGDYNPETGEWTVSVRWRTASIPTTATPTSGLNIREARIMYSWEGYPEFWTDGEYLDTYSTTADMANPLVQYGIVTTRHLSNWLYYSMFYKYTDSSGNIYTERVAKNSVLIPTYHDTGSSMLNRIPAYYRRLDTTGHLEKFLKVFGWEADICRSLIEEIMFLKDPQRVHQGSIDHLADTLGCMFTSEELRSHQLRELLGQTQRYHSQRGRADALLSLLGLVTDSEVSYRDFRVTSAAAASEPYARIQFTTTANRLNLIKDPRLNAAPGAAATWNHLTSASAGSITVGNTSAGTTGVTLTTNGSSAGTAYIFPGDAVQIKRSVPYYTSVEASLTNASAKVRLYREKPTSAGSLPPESQYYSTDDTTYANYYKTLTLNNDGTTYSTSAFEEQRGYALESSTAVAHAVYVTGTLNGTLFRARLYANTESALGDYNLKLDQQVDSSTSRFDQFDLSVVTSAGTEVLAKEDLTVNTSGEVIDEANSDAVVTKITQTTGGVDYTLLIDNVATIAYAAATQLPSDGVSTYPFLDTGVEDLYPVIVVTLNNSASVTLDKWIFQPFANGPYFDGTVLDGYSYLSGGNVVSDYAWSGTADISESQYTPFRQRTAAAIRKVITNNIPLTMSTELTSANYHTSTDHGHLVTFDAKPGDERAFDPHSWNSNVYSEGTIVSLSD